MSFPKCSLLKCLFEFETIMECERRFKKNSKREVKRDFSKFCGYEREKGEERLIEE